MSYRYTAAPGYLSPPPAMAPAHHPTHKAAGSYSYRRSEDTSMRSYHSRSDYAETTHSVGARSTYSYDARSGIATFDARSTYSPDTRSAYSPDARSAYSPDARTAYSPDARSTYSPDARSTCSYDARSTRSVDARSTYSADARPVRSTDVKSVRSTGARSSRSKSRTRADPEPQKFLSVQAVPVHYPSTGSHCSRSRSRAAPSLTHSAPSTSSDDDNESDAGHPVVGLSTPYTAKVALWRDDVNDVRNDVPPETIIPPHVKARYEYAQRQYETSPSLSSNDIPSIVVPSYTAPSRVPSPESTSPPYPLSTHPSAPAVDIERKIDEIEDIEYEVHSRILNFILPSSLDFGEKLPNGEFPSLPYTGRNKPLIEHRHYLDKTLLRMDEIQSFNDSRIKDVRKRVVTTVQEQLDQLNRMEKMVRDNMHYERWKKTPRIQVTAPPATT
ncbi:unnamed protein product [Rhizoctonia solani]|uniref:BAG domain-containing protein n=1 Tax=Rhizoctonia solani TaxID=456999 RepID=A0A8H3C7I9_9AGAM|nr:unnamed protein product [Rhizoctonia solani]